MARGPRQNDSKAARLGQATTEYFILDNDANEIAGKRIPIDPKTGERSTRIALTDSEAAFFIASGVIGTSDPERNKKAAAAVAANAGDPPASKIK